MIFFFLILLLLEFIIGFAGLERYDHKFMPRSSYPIFVAGKGDMADYYVTNPHFGAYINKQSFLRVKPADVSRIFVVGGSAAYGFPYTEEYGFSGYIRRALDQAAPNRFEIINASGMSFGSHRVLDILKDVTLYDPDLVIVYSGNNEYVEQNVLPEIKTPPAAIEKISAVFNRTDIYRAIRLGLLKAAPGVFESRIKQDVTDIRSDPQVHRGNIGRSSHTDTSILANYRNNIAAMKELLIQQGIKGIFCTVPVDLGGWLPQSDLPQFVDDAAAVRWMELLELRDAAFQKNDTALEVEYLRKILEITPQDPGMLFNYGKVLWMLGRYEAAYQELEKAKDFDFRPIRALSSFNQVIRNTIDENNAIFLADLASLVKEKYIRGQARDIFLDYCHLTETGNKLVAELLLPVLSKAVGTSRFDIEDLAGLIHNDPKAKNKDDIVRGHELYAQALTFENNGRNDLAEKNYLQALAYLPDFDQIYGNLGHLYAEQNDVKKAMEMYTTALQLNPKSHLILLAQGYISLQESRFDEAEKFFIKALNITPDLPGAYSGLGDIAMHRGEYRLAVKYYNDSLRLGEDSEWLRKNLAQAYLSLGDRQNAVLNWQNALKYSPFDQETRELVKKYSQNR
ncbi:MAG: tetratricopeptide repeat protein [Desulfobulbaceae bacterium]|nr:tetratricopeptide repeat protein [Desulfobulbaceae bacterium]